MNAEEIYGRIMAAVKSNPDCKHVKGIRSGRDLIVMGKYGYVAHTYCHFNNNTNTWRISDCICEYYDNVDTGLQTYINIVINHIREETRPDNDLCLAYRKFYEDNFPCLAAEVDYSNYITDYILDNIGGAFRGASSLEQACPGFCHWDLLAFERKVHAALDGSGLPLPIRNEIFSLFAEFNHPNWE